MADNSAAADTLGQNKEISLVPEVIAMSSTAPIPVPNTLRSNSSGAVNQALYGSTSRGRQEALYSYTYPPCKSKLLLYRQHLEYIRTHVDPSNALDGRPTN